VSMTIDKLVVERRNVNIAQTNNMAAKERDKAGSSHLN
jgi:hypothetical protein